MDAPRFTRLVRKSLALAGLICIAPAAWPTSPPPVLNLPDPKIQEVYRGNWENSLLPAIVPPTTPHQMPENPNAEPNRPWKVDVEGHYPGWYPGVDVKHMAAAYLACAKDLELVLRAWDLTVSDKYLLRDGSVRPMTFHNNPHNVVPEATANDAVVYYPLRLTANIDLLLLGDMIFRFSQDTAWLDRNLAPMRKSAEYIAQWTDSEGLLHSDSYDLDQVYREIDGVANAAAIFALRRLADLEMVSGNSEGQSRWSTLANRIAAGIEAHFWNGEQGYYEEHLAYNDLARTRELDKRIIVSQAPLDEEHEAAKALDGVRGTGIDAFGVGIGAAGQHEWATTDQDTHATLCFSIGEPVRVDEVIVYNRNDPAVGPGDRFSRGRLIIGDDPAPVNLAFNNLDVSRAIARFSPRYARILRFTGTDLQGEGGQTPGVAEILVLPEGAHYKKFSHGMTDTNFALLAFDIAPADRAQSVWDYFKAHESAFYEVDGLHAPTWIAEKADTYTPEELNKRAPYKDCVAMARIWRYDALMRRQMGDGEGIYRTIQYANTLYDRPSGGGPGFFAERYGLGRFQPGDEAMYTVAKYTGYPAIYNSFIVQQALLGVDVDVWGTISIAPCVPESWYESGFGAEGLGVVQHRDLAFEYNKLRVSGWVRGKAGLQRLRVKLAPGFSGNTYRLGTGPETQSIRLSDGFASVALSVPASGAVTFSLTPESD